MHTAMAHSTVTFERTFAASRERLFDAWRDPAKRATWAVPFEGVTINYTATDFRQGGLDRCECVAGDDRFTIENIYLAIAQDAQIVMSETLIVEDAVQGASLVSAEFLEHGEGSRLALTIQTVGLAGSGFEQEVQEGWRHAVDAMALLLDAPASAA